MDVGLVILACSALCVAAILAGAAGQRIDAPLLLVFLLVGMLAGHEGPGGLSVDASPAVLTWASAALGAILFEGGLRTQLRTFRLGAGPGLGLAVGATVATAFLVAPAARALFGLDWTSALLLGAIVSSTDAAAVFALAATGMRMPERISATLEVESGNNDPIAILLVAGLSLSLAGAPLSGLDWAVLVAQKIVLGAAPGFAVGWLSPSVLRRAGLPPGLKSILAAALGFVAFGLAETIGGSGFLAIYLAGLVLSARDPDEAERAGGLMDGLAWLAQTGLFLVLGLLITPSHLASVAAPALGLALALILIARPVAVAGALAPFGFRLPEMTFIAWTGLRGATPVFLGLLPAAFGVENGNLFLSVAAAVVLVSLVIQGWTAPMMGRALRISEGEPQPVGRGETLARLSAVASAIAVGAWFAVTLARPTPLIVVAPDSVDDLRAVLETSFETPARFPQDFAALPAEDRRPLFVATVAAAMRGANGVIEADRAVLQAYADKQAGAGRLSLEDQARIDALARRYGMRYAAPEVLRERIDVVPPRLAAAQAGLATGWGSAAPALAKNAVFGLKLSEGYPDLKSAALSLATLYASHPDFDALRKARAEARADGAAPTAEALAPHLAGFAEPGSGYAAQIEAILKTSPVGDD